MKRQSDTIQLTKEQKGQAAAKLRDYIAEHFDVEIGHMQSDFMVDFITESLGVYYYNHAIADSMSWMTEKVEDMYLLIKDED